MPKIQSTIKSFFQKSKPNEDQIPNYDFDPENITFEADLQRNIKQEVLEKFDYRRLLTNKKIKEEDIEKHQIKTEKESYSESEDGTPFKDDIRSQTDLNLDGSDERINIFCSEIEADCDDFKVGVKEKQQKSYTCPFKDCNDTIDICKDFIAHMKSCKYVGQNYDAYLKLYKCHLCENPREFKWVPVLVQHIQLFHLKIKLHKCKQCGKKYEAKSKLRNHILVVHDHIKEFKCKLCAKTFSQNGGLSRHIHSFHENIKPLKRFSCKMCPKRFVQRTVLENHIKTFHEHQRPFKCNICNKGFTRKGSVKIHLENVHKKKKPYN